MPDHPLAAMRVQYTGTGWDVDALADSWHAQLIAWLDEARAAGVVEANAMVLATAAQDGRPSSRSVLCKGVDARGVVFFTNYTSAKSRDLRATPYASATFPWYLLHRQVHVRGSVDVVDPAETAAYWAGRPRGSQLGAWASAQSAVISHRRALDDALAVTTKRFAGGEVPVPPHWGGWRIVPDQVEFWQGKPDRMHDRLRFELDDHTRTWRVRRLAP